MGVFDRQIAIVQKLISKYGQTVEFKTITQTITNPAKPWEATDSTISTNLKMIFLSPSASGESLLGRELLQYMKGTEVSFGEIRGLMAFHSTVVPKMADIVVRDSKELKIKAIDILAPNGQTILYTIEFEK